MTERQSYFTIPIIEQTLCAFSFPTCAKPHRDCFVDNCLDRGGDICLVDRMRRYLNSTHKLIEDPDFQSFQKETDLFYLESALKNPHLSKNKQVLTFLAQAKIHRLRYRNHRDLGVALVEHLIKELRSVLERQNCLQSIDYTIHHQREHLDQFKTLCHQTELRSVNEIYRLFELTQGWRFAHSTNLPPTLHLALLFAFGYEKNSDPPLGSIGELVAKIDFYEAFAKKLKEEKKIHGDLLYQELLKEENCKIVSNLWKGFLKAASNVQARQITSALNSSRIQQAIEQHIVEGGTSLARDRNLIFHLRSDLSVPRLLPSSSQFSFDPVHRFASPFNGAYHPFKHEDKMALFLLGIKGACLFSLQECLSWEESHYVEYAEKSLRAYFKMIDEVIATGHLLKIQPSQFEHATIFNFECVRATKEKDYTFNVLVTHRHQGLSYILTCY